MEHSRRIARLILSLVGLAIAAAVGASGSTHKSYSFGGPLFGLDGSGHGRLLIADASVGIVPLRRGTPITLPGITDVSTARGATWAVTGATGAPPDGPQNDTGQALHLIENGVPQKIANLFEFERDYNPHTEFGALVPDSNPFDVYALGRHAALVVDAGGNDLLRVDRDGNIKLLAVFPTALVSTANIKALAGCPDSGADFCGLPDMIPGQPVPTSIAVDRYGYIYVGELKGFPAPAGASNIWRISPRADAAQCGVSPDCVKAFDGGFTSVIDLAFGADGNLYVAELDEASWAAVEIFGTPAGGTINACNVRRGYCREVAENIPELTAIAFDDDGDLWATRHALIPGEAEVFEVRLHGRGHGRRDGHYDRDRYDSDRYYR